MPSSSTSNVRFPAAAAAGRAPRRLGFAALLLVAGAASGCAGFVEPVWDATGKRLIAIPFRDMTAERNHRWYGATDNGRQAVLYFRAWAESQLVGDSIVVGSDASRVAQNVMNWLEDRIQPEDWRRLLAGVEADVILLGEIEAFRYKRENDVNIYRGSAEVSYRIIDARSGRTLYSTPTPREVEFPKETRVSVPFLTSDDDTMKKIRAGLLRALGERVGQDLYGYFED